MESPQSLHWASALRALHHGHAVHDEWRWHFKGLKATPAYVCRDPNQAGGTHEGAANANASARSLSESLAVHCFCSIASGAPLHALHFTSLPPKTR